MEANKLILLVCCLLVELAVYPQYNFNFDKEDCFNYNAAIFSQALIEVAGQEKVSKLLESELSGYIYFTVDSFGCVEDIVRTKFRVPELIDDTTKEGIELIDDTIKEEIKNYLKNNNSQFFICLVIDPDRDTCKVYNEHSEGYRKSRRLPHAFGTFPIGGIFFYLEYKRYLRKNPENPLTIFDFLLEEIKKYHHKAGPVPAQVCDLFP